MAGAGGAGADPRGRGRVRRRGDPARERRAESAPPADEARQPTAPAPRSDAEAYAKTKLAKAAPAATVAAPRRSGSPVPLVAVAGRARRRRRAGAALSRRRSTTTWSPPVASDDGGAPAPAPTVDAGVVGGRQAAPGRRARGAAAGARGLARRPRPRTTWRCSLPSTRAVCLTPGRARDLVIPGAGARRASSATRSCPRRWRSAATCWRRASCRRASPWRCRRSCAATRRSRRAPAAGASRTSARSPRPTIRRCASRSSGRTARSASGASRCASTLRRFAALCERQAAVDAYAERAHDARARALERYLHATPPESAGRRTTGCATRSSTPSATRRRRR